MQPAALRVAGQQVGAVDVVGDPEAHGPGSVLHGCRGLKPRAGERAHGRRERVVEARERPSEQRREGRRDRRPRRTAGSRARPAACPGSRRRARAAPPPRPGPRARAGPPGGPCRARPRPRARAAARSVTASGPTRSKTVGKAPAGRVAAARTSAAASDTAIGCMRYEPSPGISTSPPSSAATTMGTNASPGPTHVRGPEDDALDAGAEEDRLRRELREEVRVRAAGAAAVARDAEAGEVDDTRHARVARVLEDALGEADVDALVGVAAALGADLREVDDGGAAVEGPHERLGIAADDHDRPAAVLSHDLRGRLGAHGAHHLEAGPHGLARRRDGPRSRWRPSPRCASCRASAWRPGRC